MKKSLSLLLVLVLVLAALAGCSSPAAEAPAAEEPAAEEPAAEEPAAEEPAAVEEFSYATGGTSGTYYPLGGAMAAVWNDNIEGINVTIQPAGASVENINRLASGEVDMGLAMNNVAAEAYEGVGDSFANPLTNFYAIGVVYPEVMHVVTTQDSGIETIADLQGKRVNPGPPGSGTYVTAVEILKAFGVDDYKSNPGSFTDAVAGLKDGTLDAAFAVVSFPASAVQEIAASRDVKILEITGAEFEAIKENIPFIAEYPIKGGVYKGQDEDAMTIALQAALYVREGISDDVAYNLAKVMYENTAKIAETHKTGEQITIDRALDGITTPVHPGAQKYYDEVK
ncbi:MAG: hypothetical protein AVO33_06425 [delta proteobacterium ML8_F1]|nr:MAG: hypothetical protein AVO33_06425 [delta proteobacterium ML8_F1]